MSVWVDPNLLSLAGVGVASDPDTPDGRHLRWFFGAPLGFPRGGIRLRRHASKALASWDNATTPDPLIRTQFLSQADLGTGPSRRFDSGLNVAKSGGLAYAGVAGGPSPLLRVDALPVTFDFGPFGAGPTFPPGPNLSNPAAFVRLTIVRRRRTGFAFATASYDAQGDWRVQDRAGVGVERPGWFPPDLADHVLSTSVGMRIRSAGERRFDVDAFAARDRDAASALARAGRAPRPLPGSPPVALDPNPWVTQTILLRGSFIDRVEVTGADAALSRIQWILVRNYAGSPAWVDVERFFLPLTESPDLYPAWTTSTAADVAKQRLFLAPPKHNVPWDDPARAVADNLDARYRGDAFAEMDEAMRLFLKGQIADLVPQSEVEIEQELEDMSGDPEGSMVARVRPFQHLYAAAADPHVARILGLMTTDTTDPAGLYDYMVDMDVPPLWTQWALFPEPARLRAEELRAAGIDGGQELADFERPDTCIALATAIAIAASLVPAPPEDLRADVRNDVAVEPIPAFVELSWRAQALTHFDNDGTSRVFYALTRNGPDGEVTLHHKDDDTGLLMPHAPTQRQPPDGRLRSVDRTIPAWATYTWSLRGMDLWGRWSPAADVTAEVRDTIAPPAPTSLAARIEGDAAAAPFWDALVVSFDWTMGQVSVSPDLTHFEIHLRQGEITRAMAAQPSTWGRFEHAPGATAPPVLLRWPSLAFDALPAGMTGSATTEAIPLEEGGGLRIELLFAPVQAAFGVDEKASLSVTMRAVDEFANPSGYAAHAPAARLSETQALPPPMPGDIALASRPDVQRRCTFRHSWPDLGGGRVRVLRASARALLVTANADAAAYDALDPTAQAAFLRGLALANRKAFMSDHEFPYPATAGEHFSYLNAGERGLTVYVIEPVSVNEVRPPWPTDAHQFVVVAVPPPRPLEAPLALEVRAGDRHVTISVLPNASGEVARLRLYRARNVDDSVDLRRMRLVADVGNVSSTEPTIFDDDALYADIDYWYRLVALAADGAMSPPGAPLRARPYSSLPPPAPTLLAVVRQGATATRRVTCVVPRRDLPLTLLRRRKGELDVQPAAGPHIASGGFVDVAAVPQATVAEGYQLTVDDVVPADPNARYVYRLRLRDRQGRFVESATVEETP